MENQYIQVERNESGVVTITLNAPEHLNPWYIPMMEEMTVELDHIKSNTEDRVVIFTGAGRAFSSGGDVSAFQQGENQPIPHFMKEKTGRGRGGWNVPTMESEERLKNEPFNGRRIHMQVYNLDKPTIAAVNGVAAGAGCDLALACDIRLASKDARFIEVYVRRGLIPLDGGAFWAPFLLPHGIAMQMLFTGEALSAEDAFKFGLVNNIYDKKDLLPASLELATKIAKGPPVTQQLTKHMVREFHLEMFKSHWDLIDKASAHIRETRDFDEGINSFMEKRSPDFKGF